MGPSGSGKSTLMHCLAGLDTATSGEVYVGGDRLSGMSDKRLTELRRDKVGFVFQQFNLLPTLTAEENIPLPLAIAGRKPDPGWFDTVVAAVGLARPARPPADRAVRRPAAAGGLRPGAGRPAGGGLRRRADRQPRLALRRRGARLPAPLGARARPDHRHGHPRPDRRRYADRVLFLADGRIVDEMRAPTAETVLDRMKGLEPGQDTLYARAGA